MTEIYDKENFALIQCRCHSMDRIKFESLISDEEGRRGESGSPFRNLLILI